MERIPFPVTDEQRLVAAIAALKTATAAHVEAKAALKAAELAELEADHKAQDARQEVENIVHVMARP